jgi:solute carrier family 25 aspartate/glutamate transporter 12/13
MVKTRLQNQKVGPSGERLYKGALDCFRQIVSKEGTRGLYRGLGPNLIGVTPEKALKVPCAHIATHTLPHDTHDTHDTHTHTRTTSSRGRWCAEDSWR